MNNETDIHASIEALVAEEHALFDQGPVSTQERTRLGEINVQLDRLYDLLRQRRAKAEFPDSVLTPSERSAATVEGYVE